MKKFFYNINLIFSKEIREAIRDKRTLFMTIFLPIILYPVLLLGVTQLFIFQVKEISKQTIKVAVEGESKQLIEVLKKNNIEIIYGNISSWEMVNKGKADLGLKIPENFEKNLGKEIQKISLYYSKSNDKSKIYSKKLENILTKFIYKQKEIYLKDYPAGVIQPFQIVLKNTAEASKQGAFELGKILAFMVVLISITFSLYPAIDMGAGEKERGTMETLLVSPASRTEIVLGKYAAILFISLVGASLNIASMGLTLGHFAKQIGGGISPARISEQESIFKDVAVEKEATLHIENSNWIFFTEKNNALSVNKKGDIRLFNIPSEKIIFELKDLFNTEICSVLLINKDELLLGDNKGNLWNVKISKKEKILKYTSQYIPLNLCLSKDKNNLALISKNNILLLKTSDYKPYKTLPNTAEEVIFLSNNKLLLVSDKIKLYDLDKMIYNLDGNIVKIFDEQFMFIGNKNGEIKIANILTGEVNSTNSNQKSMIKSMFLTEDKKYLFTGSLDNRVKMWEIIKSRKNVDLRFIGVVGEHDYPITNIKVSGKDFCFASDESGIIKRWNLESSIKFSVSFSVFLKIFAIIIPLLGLFSALSLSISVFARSYKEGQHYLSPLVIIIMPLVMISLLPDIRINNFFSIVPVTGVVLLYKELFIDKISWIHFALVFFSTFFYAILALLWTVSLFKKEDVLFRETSEAGWEFWKNKKIKISQILTIFFIVFVLYYYVGAAFNKYGFFKANVLSQTIFLLALPIIINFSFKFSFKETFFIKKFLCKDLFASILMYPFAFLAAREGTTIFLKIFPIDTKGLSKAYEFLEIYISKFPMWTIILVFAIVPGICEEFFFRGFILSNLKKKLNYKKAIATTAFLFAIIHVDISRFIFTFTMGLFLGFILIKTKSIFVPIIIHIIVNSTTVVIANIIKKYPESKLSLLLDTNKHVPILWLIIAFLVFIISYFFVLKNKE